MFSLETLASLICSPCPKTKLFYALLYSCHSPSPSGLFLWKCYLAQCFITSLQKNNHFILWIPKEIIVSPKLYKPIHYIYIWNCNNHVWAWSYCVDLKHFIIVDASMASGARPPGLKYRQWKFLAVWIWTCYLNTLRFSIPVSKNEILTILV